MVVYWATGLLLLAYLILSWFMGSWLHLKGSDLWVLRIGLAVVGFLAAGIFLWFHRRTRLLISNEGDETSMEDIDLLIREAARQLKSSRLLRGAELGQLPLIYLLGESASAKTSTIINSGLDPELLAGQAHRDSSVIPTATANIWYTRQAVFVDAGGALLSQPSRWTRLVKRLQPGRFSSAARKRQQPPRAGIVCVDCEKFLKPGASHSIQTLARGIASRLEQVSLLLGISFPVYVLFTKLDRIPFFAEYVGNLTKEEASQVFGTTLPVRPLHSTGVYAEEETKRLTKAFDELFYSLAEKRVDLLGREHDSEKLGGVYEFPRELRKLRTLLVEFLIELGRPSHLRVNPFLRGFYFSGVRAIYVDDMAPIAGEPVADEPVGDAGATRIFSGAQMRAQAAIPARAVGSRKIPQWAFVTRLFNDVILKDHVALSASAFSTRISFLRRTFLVAAICLCAICLVGFTTSFLGNRALEADVIDAGNELPTTQLREGQLPTVPDLQHLERLRQSVATLARYEREGPPWRLRWGLYIGDRLYPQARGLYFSRLRELLLDRTQQNLLAWLRGLPDTPGPDGSYEKTYNALKVYLITTLNHEKSTPEFVVPVLQAHWTPHAEIDAERVDLARRQFDFYSTELIPENPYILDQDPGTVSRARNYLSKFGGIDSHYLPLIAEASHNNPGVSFNEQFTDSAGVLTSNYKVRGAFTRGGFSFMEGALRQSKLYSTGEEWVLGPVTASQLDPAVLQQKLRERYYGDFIQEWRTVLARSHVIGFGIHDAVPKLEKLTSPTSPLLELFWFVSHNTDVGVSSITEPFSSLQTLEPPGPADRLPDQYQLPSNKDYVLALTKLESDIATLQHSPQGMADPVLATQAFNSAGAARVAIAQVMGGRVDQQFHTEAIVRELLQEPITYVEGLLKQGPIQAINEAGRGLCQQFASVSRRYPLNPDSSEDLSIDALNSVLAPRTGAIWAFYDKTLTPYLPKQGSQYVPSSSGDIKVSGEFVRFFNRAADLSAALYPLGSAPPRFQYSLKELPSNVEGLVLKIGGETLSGAGQQKTFFWTGTSENVDVTTKGGDVLQSYRGPWAVFHFVADSRTPVFGPVTNLLWILQNNGRPIMLPNGRQKSYNYELQVSGINPFQQHEFSSLRCVSQIAK